MKVRSALILLGLVLIVCGLVNAARGATLHRDRVIAGMIRQRFGPAHDDTALCEAAAESTGDHRKPYHFNPAARSRTDDHGLFQIHQGLRTYGRRIYRVAFNINVAWRKSNHGRDWSQWTGTYGHGLCHGLT